MTAGTPRRSRRAGRQEPIDPPTHGWDLLPPASPEWRRAVPGASTRLNRPASAGGKRQPPSLRPAVAGWDRSVKNPSRRGHPHHLRTCSGSAARIDGDRPNTVSRRQTFDPLPHPPICPRRGGRAKGLISGWRCALLQSVQVFKDDDPEPMPRQLLDGMVDELVAGDAGAPLAFAAGAGGPMPRLAANPCQSPAARCRMSLLIPITSPF
jgi:hypothetical protein